MQVLKAKPPCFEEAAKLFHIKESDPVFFTYGPDCYSPSGAPITPDLIVHEETHVEQQEANKDVAAIWWKRYLADPEFRIDQEAQAYGKQYAFLCRKDGNRDWRRKVLKTLSKQLSSKMYGSVISEDVAKDKIKFYAA